MAEEQQGQERSEQPTNKRLDEARKKGQVARSRELISMASRWMDNVIRDFNYRSSVAPE